MRWIFPLSSRLTVADIAAVVQSPPRQLDVQNPICPSFDMTRYRYHAERAPAITPPCHFEGASATEKSFKMSLFVPHHTGGGVIPNERSECGIFLIRTDRIRAAHFALTEDDKNPLYHPLISGGFPVRNKQRR